jgi:hypothetical protein
MPAYVDDIGFVLSEVARIGQMNPREAIKLPFPGGLAMLPHPSGTGFMLCGMAAYSPNSRTPAHRRQASSQHLLLPTNGRSATKWLRLACPPSIPFVAPPPEACRTARHSGPGFPAV